MYAALPTTIPVPVMGPAVAASVTALAMTKSATRAWRAANSTFSGLMSRWMIWWPWA